MFMLGYEIEFGHMEMISLISSQKYSEKNVGYIAASLLLRSGDEMMTLVINSMRNDLVSHSNPAQTLALATIANLGGPDLREALANDVQRLLLTPGTEPNVKKKAALCILRFYRESPESFVLAEWADKLPSLLGEKHLGVVTSVMALLLGLASKAPIEFEGLVPYVLHLLTRLVIHKACDRDYLYYDTPTPWLQVRLIKFLQLYPPPSDEAQNTKLTDVLTKVLDKTEVSESVNKSNADHSVLFETINLIILQGEASEASLRAQAMTLLGRFIGVKEPNIRYLGLETMARLVRLEGNATIKQHKDIVIMSLKDADISMRRRALDLLFVMSDTDNARDIVEELMLHLSTSDAAIREEMVLKIAILAEKFTTDLNWYVDKMLQMISEAGDFVAPDVWHRIIQIVTNNKELQQAYAAERLFMALQAKRPHETAVSVGGYILGEFGYFIAEQEGMSGPDQFYALHNHFSSSSQSTQALLMSTYAKLCNLYPECVDLVAPVFQKFSTSACLELQQRACEYVNLLGVGADVMEAVLKEMPLFPETEETGPEARLREQLDEREADVLGGAHDRGGSDDDSGDEGGEGSDALEEAGSQTNVVNDLLGIEGSPDKPPPPPPPHEEGSPGDVVGIPQEMYPKLRIWFNALITSPKGILFEDQLIKVGLVQEYRESQGRLMLYYFNLSGSLMDGFSAVLDEVSYLRRKVGDLPSKMDVGGQTRQEVMCECMEPFTEVPELYVTFTIHGTSYGYSLRLPILANCFMEPAALAPDAFQQRWPALEGEGRDVRETLPSSSPVDESRMDSVAGIISNDLKLAVNSSSGQSITASGTFRTGAPGPNQGKLIIGTMLLIEALPQENALSVSVRAVRGEVAQGLLNVLKLVLA
ncbi:unnamed protein product [Chrysoparadoxa australica]